MNDVDRAKALMTLFLNLDYWQRAEFIKEIEILNSRDNFMMTTLAHHFKPIHHLITQGGDHEDDQQHMGIYALGHYNNNQRNALDVRCDSFTDYYIDNDGNDWFDAILLTLCECRCDLK